MNLVRAIELAKDVGAKVFGIVGRDGGFTAAGGGRLRRHPAAVSRPHHAAHRGPVRRGLAPAGQPSGPEEAADEVGIVEVAV